MQFPVSSGQHHRLNESEWVPVVPAKPPKKDKEPQQQPLAIMPAPSAVPDVSQPIAPQPVPPVKSVQPVPPVLDAGKLDTNFAYFSFICINFYIRSNSSCVDSVAATNCRTNTNTNDNE